MSKPDFFSDLKIPAVAAPMFLISGPKLVVECCKNGIVGTFPALNQRTTEGFEEWVIQIKKELDEFEKETGKKAAPFGVNLIVHNTNPRVKDDLMICVKHKVPIIITSLGAVSQLVGAVHSYGGLVYHDIIKKRHAEKAAEAGVDGMMEPDVVAQEVLKCIAEEKFLVLPHTEVAEYVSRKGNDRDRWISGMQRLQKQYEDFLTPVDMK